MYALVAAVMHMGEIRFKQRPREEQAEADDVKGVLFKLKGEFFVKF